MTQHPYAPDYTGNIPFPSAPVPKSPRVLGQFVVGGLLALALVELVARLLSLHAFEQVVEATAAGTVDDEGTPDNPLAIIEAVLAGFVPLVGWLCVGILFICWLWRASNNLGRWGRAWAPGWAIGAWFVPFASVVLPLLAVAEVDRLSDERAAAGDHRPLNRHRWVVLAMWWAGFLVCQLTSPGLIATFLAFGLATEQMDEMQARLIVIAVNAVAFVVVAGSAVMAALLVRRISANQERMIATGQH